ncbi:hypothetical protein EB118_07505, partial [bacterium]|nr:hypothetical protein [bacterium]
QNNSEANAQAERLQNWMGDPTKVDQQTAQDIVDYLSTQPYQDKNGSLHDPKTGKFVKHNDIHNDKIDAHYDETQAKSNDQKTLKELISGWAEADDAGDKTTSGDIQDEIMNRIEREKGLTEDHKVAMIDVVYNKKEQLRASDTGKTEENNEDPFAKPPVAGTEVIFNPFDSKPDISTKVDMPSPINPFDVPATADGDESKDLTPEDNEEGAVGIPVIVEQTEHASTSEEKKPRGKIAKRIGAIVVGLAAIGGGLFVGNKLANDSNEQPKVTTEQTVPESTTPTTTAEASVNGAITGAETGQTSTGGTQEAANNVDISDWTWNVAHNLAPGQETQLIQKGIDEYNKANGTDFALKSIDGTTMIIDGTGEIVNSVEMEYINQLMINAAE